MGLPTQHHNQSQGTLVYVIRVPQPTTTRCNHCNENLLADRLGAAASQSELPRGEERRSTHRGGPREQAEGEGGKPVVKA